MPNMWHVHRSVPSPVGVEHGCQTCGTSQTFINMWHIHRSVPLPWAWSTVVERRHGAQRRTRLWSTAWSTAVEHSVEHGWGAQCRARLGSRAWSMVVEHSVKHGCGLHRGARGWLWSTVVEHTLEHGCGHSMVHGCGAQRGTASRAQRVWSRRGGEQGAACFGVGLGVRGVGWGAAAGTCTGLAGSVRGEPKPPCSLLGRTCWRPAAAGVSVGSQSSRARCEQPRQGPPVPHLPGPPQSPACAPPHRGWWWRGSVIRARS